MMIDFGVFKKSNGSRTLYAQFASKRVVPGFEVRWAHVERADSGESLNVPWMMSIPFNGDTQGPITFYGTAAYPLIEQRSAHDYSLWTSFSGPTVIERLAGAAVKPSNAFLRDLEQHLYQFTLHVIAPPVAARVPFTLNLKGDGDPFEQLTRGLPSNLEFEDAGR